MQTNTLPRTLTTHDVGQIFKVQPRTVRAWQRAGKLVAIRIGRELRFRMEDIRRLLENA
jgi:excisionase family DNA binding protein